MSVTIAVTKSVELPNGERLIAGTMTPDSSWLAAGEVFDLSSYLSGSPLVIMESTAVTYKHDKGTASAGKILAYYADYDAGADGILIAVADATDISAQVANFIAIGKAV